MCNRSLLVLGRHRQDAAGVGRPERWSSAHITWTLRMVSAVGSLGLLICHLEQLMANSRKRVGISQG